MSVLPSSPTHQSDRRRSPLMLQEENVLQEPSSLKLRNAATAPPLLAVDSLAHSPPGRLSSSSDDTYRESEGPASEVPSPSYYRSLGEQHTSSTNLADHFSGISLSVPMPSVTTPYRMKRQPFTLYLMRHANSVTNQMGSDQNVFDPPLSELGEIQVKSCARGLAEDIDPHFVITSPLTRALQTAEGVFGTYMNFDHGDVVPLAVAEEAREAVGFNCIAEFREKISVLQRTFPSVDFSMYDALPTDDNNVREANVLYKDHDVIASTQLANESTASVKRRGRSLLQRVFGRFCPQHGDQDTAGAPLPPMVNFESLLQDVPSHPGSAQDAPTHVKVAVVSHFHLIRTLIQQLYEHHCSSTVVGSSSNVFSEVMKNFAQPITRENAGKLGKILGNGKAIMIRGEWLPRTTADDAVQNHAELPVVTECRLV